MRYRLAILLICAGTSSAAAQPGGARGLVPCRGQRIDSVIVDAQAPTVAGLSRVPVLGNVVRETHVVTREDVVRGYLLLRVGDRCTELRRAESERILRAQPYLADASIEVLSNNRGGVVLDVRTIDEASLILSGAIGTVGPNVRAARIGSSNLAGRGIATSIAWRYRQYFDDVMQIRIADHQFAGKPYVLAVSLLRDPLGRDDRAELMLPFRTDVQRFAWRGVVGESRGHALFAARDSGRLALGYGREYAELGGMVRVGPPGKLTLFGLSFTNERAFPDTAAARVTDVGLFSDTASAFGGRFMETRAARVNALLGLRGLRYMRTRAIDALRGTQDVPLGLQFGALVGRGVPALGAVSNDLFVASDLYLGYGSPGRIVRLQFQGEGRRQRGSGEWDGLVGTGRLARHSRVTDRRTRSVTVEWSGTSRVLMPHALSLGVPEGGVRGFREEESSVGGRRAVARIEERVFLGTPFDFGDFGFSVFSDAGRLWPGDVPYGDVTQIRVSAGASVLLAIPMRSTRTWRLEFAVPLNKLPGMSPWELRLSHRDLTTFFWREPVDVDAARARAVPASIYNWP
ncbi:MAG: hypothetical protein WD801_07940 [Gemmatimonadaceae bacterium]